jgi:hypothetical protein
MPVNVTIRARLGSAVVFSRADDRSDPQQLHNESTEALSGDIYPYLDPSDDITSVEWFLNDVSQGVKTTAPYDLVGDSIGAADPLDLLTLGSGVHTCVAVIARDDGHVETVGGPFEVALDPTIEEIVVSAQVPNPVVTVIGGGDASVNASVITVGTTLTRPTVTTGTAANNAKLGAGFFARNSITGISGAYTSDDDHLEGIEDYYDRRFSYVKELLSKEGHGALMSGAREMMTNTSGMRRLRDRQPFPAIWEINLPLFYVTDGYKASPAAHRTAYQACAAGDFDDRYQELVDVCIAGGWGTVTDNLWFEIFHEFDVPGHANPSGINHGNADVAVESFIHVSNFLKTRLPRVGICGGRISNGQPAYLLANGSPSGKTMTEALFDEWENRGDPSTQIDLFYQNLYDNRTWAASEARLDDAYAVCEQYDLLFGMSEWGLFDAAHGGFLDNPDFIENVYDWQASHDRYHHGMYFEGLDWSGIIQNGWTNSGNRFRTLFAL